MKCEHVIVIMDTAFNDDLAAIAEKFPVWIIQSSENRRLIEMVAMPTRANISTFCAEGRISLVDTFLAALELICDHHDEYSEWGIWQKLTVLGLNEKNTVDSALKKAEIDGRIYAINDGFLVELVQS